MDKHDQTQKHSSPHKSERPRAVVWPGRWGGPRSNVGRSENPQKAQRYREGRAQIEGAEKDRGPEGRGRTRTRILDQEIRRCLEKKSGSTSWGYLRR